MEQKCWRVLAVAASITITSYVAVIAPANAANGRATVPTAPLSVHAIAKNSAATVRWSRPSSNGGRAIRSFFVESKPSGHTCVTVATKCTIFKLHNGTAYKFIVTARNSVGISAKSKASNKVMPVAPLFGVVFNASGGSGTMKDEINREGTSAPLTANVFTRTGYTFSGWNSAADGSGAGYTNGATYLVVANATLYAQWTIAASQFQTSSNWAGYILNGGVGGYQAVSGQWTVPTLNCQATPDGNVSVWVGVNGVNTSHGLFQDGTSSSCANGVETSYAWWTDEAMGYLTQTVFQVQTGDVITADVTQTPSGTWQYDVSDITTGAVSSQVEGYSGVGTSAEWIVEDPGMASGGLYPLGNFGSETITDLGLTVPSGSWTLPTPSDAMELTPIPFT